MNKEWSENNKKIRRSKNLILFSSGIILVLLLVGWTIRQNMKYSAHLNTTVKSTVMLDGEYSLDGGPWKPIDNQTPIRETFHKVVFKGPLNNVVSSRVMNSMNVVSKNVWYKLYDENGNAIIDYHPSEEADLELSGYMAAKLPNTPGYLIVTEFLSLSDSYKKDGEFTLEVEYAYGHNTESFSDCFYVVTSLSEGLYLKFFYEILPSIIVFLLVCFFGVFFFPIAGGLLGKIDFRYIAFGILCFFAGLYLLLYRSSWYMNLWIEDPTVCMMTEKIAAGLFETAILIYLRSLLNSRISKGIANTLVIGYFTLTLICVILHATGRSDMMMTLGIRYFVIAIFFLIMTVLLCKEIIGKKGRELFEYLFSFIPLCILLILEIIASYMKSPSGRFLKIGLAITIIYQMVRFAIDFRRQYKEAIRYQQVQKELYEAKVNVMVSQIRPHFMYNALSSIAILCKLDPDTAYEATVTFSDYLRGNMDSLKQTAPVPFETELEHLKKYMYIEKLRFDDKLNIEYDIGDTDFEIPLLSIQPLVENAVKHGVGMKEEGGTVKISTKETESAHEVIIEDDGVGFDPAEKKDDGRSHIGMENTKKRLKDMVGGDVIIQSEPGKGTTVRVIIPKKEEDGK